MDPANTETERPTDFIGSPVQNHEQNSTHMNVVILILIDLGLKI